MMLSVFLCRKILVFTISSILVPSHIKYSEGQKHNIVSYSSTSSRLAVDTSASNRMYPYYDVGSNDGDDKAILITTCNNDMIDKTSTKSEGYPLSYGGVPREALSSHKTDSETTASSTKASSSNLDDGRLHLFAGYARTFSPADDGSSSSSPLLTLDGGNDDDFDIDDQGYDYKHWRRHDYDHIQHRASNIHDVHNRRSRTSYINKDHNNIYQNVQLNYLRRQPITPVVYRFFARSQAARAAAASITAGGGSIPFILLVPNVDHWKITGQELAARGYNVIAVGPKRPDDGEEIDDVANRDGDSQNDNYDIDYDVLRRSSQGPALIIQLMDALRWTKVVLVGCDNESMLAIRAAIELSASPDDNDVDRRVVGLMICGKLDETERMLRSPSDSVDYGTSYYYNRRLPPPRSGNSLIIDRFLEEQLLCPYTIIWDGGDESRNPMPASTIINSERKRKSLHVNDIDSHNQQQHRHRTLIIGGGSAPHRRRPEYFAWVLSRFVEENIAPAINLNVERKNPVPPQQRRMNKMNEGRMHALKNIPSSQDSSLKFPNLPVPWRMPEMLNEESFVVFGRVAATTLFYAMAIKVLFYQYENLRFGIDMITLFRQTTVGTFRRAVLKTGSILFFNRHTSVSDNDNGITGVEDIINIQEHEENEEKPVTDGSAGSLEDKGTKHQNHGLNRLKSLYSRVRHGPVKTLLFGTEDNQPKANLDRLSDGIEEDKGSGDKQEGGSRELDSESKSDAQLKQDTDDKKAPGHDLEPDSTPNEKRRLKPIFLLDQVIT